MAPPVPSIPGYTLLDPIGRGGFGIVFAATAEGDGAGDTVAVKVLTRTLDPDAAQRFVDEVQVMGTLAWHPHVVQILGAGVAEGLPWIAMEHLAGGSVGDALDTGGPLDPDAATAVAAQAAAGLQVAHQAGLLHRDVKPDNLLRRADGLVKVSDFGVAAAAGGSGARRGTSGTIAYSAPELLNGAAPSVSSDVYSLGASLFAMLTGAPAFARDTDESPAAMILRAYREPVPDLAAEGVPAPLARVVGRAMAKDPAGRPADAGALLAELQGARRDLGLPPAVVAGVRGPAAAPAPASPPPAAAAVGGGLPDQPPAEARARAQRMQRILGGVGAAAAALVAVTFVATSMFGGGGDPGDSAAEAPPPEEEVVEEAPADVPAPTAVPDPAAPPAPAPPPPAPAPPPPAPSPLPELPATGPQVEALVGLDGVVWQIRPDTIRRDPQDGGLGTEVTVEGAIDAAVTVDALAVAVQDGPVQLLDPIDLGIAGQVDVVATEVVAAAGSFWAATADGLTAFSPDGTVTTTVPAGDVVAVATAPDGATVWALTADGALVAVDTADASVLLDPVPVGPAVELAVDADGDALVVTPDGALLEVALADGTPQEVEVPAGLQDVAVTLDGTRWFVADAAAFVARPGAAIAPLDLGAPARLVEPARVEVWFALDDDTVVPQR